MSRNIKQIYNNNPLNGAIPLNALTYFGLSPFNTSDDAASTFNNVLNNTVSYFGNLPASVYSTGTISQTGIIITGTGTTFTSNMNGGYFFPATGSVCRVFFVDATHLMASVSQTISSGTTYALSYYFPDLIDIQLPATVSLWENAAFIAMGNSTAVSSNRSMSIDQRGFAAGQVAEDLISSNQFASQSGNAITGSGSSLDLSANQIGKLIIYSSGQSAFYVDINTAANSQTVPLTSFIIPGQTTNNFVVSDELGNFGANGIWIKDFARFQAYNSGTTAFSSVIFQNTNSNGFQIYNYDLTNNYNLMNIGTGLSSTFGIINLPQGNLTTTIGSGSKTVTNPSFFHALNQGTTVTNTAYFLAETTTSSTADAFSSWKITSGNQFSAGTSGATGLYSLTNSSSLQTGNVLYSTDINGNHIFSSGGNFHGTFDVENTLSHFHFNFTMGASYNDDLSLSASQSGFVVTGSGTNFTSGMRGGIIFWPSTPNIALIKSVDSTTSLTVDTSFSQTNAPFIIYYGSLAYNYNTTTLSIAPLVNFLVNGTLSFATIPFSQGTITQSGTNVTFSAGVTSEFFGGYVIPSSGSPFNLISYNGTSTLQASISQTIAPGTTFTLYYFNNTNPYGINSDQPAFLNLFNGAPKIYMGSGSESLLAQFNNNGSGIFANGLTIGGNNTNRFTIGNPTASQTTTTVTTTGTFLQTDVGHMIMFANGETSFITAYIDATHVTVIPSQTVVLQQYIVIGKSIDATSIDANGNLGANNIYAYTNFYTQLIDTIPSINTLNIAQANALLIQIGKTGALTYGGESLTTGLRYNASLSLSASQSSTTVTGSGTTFTAAMTNGRIFWPSTGNNANIIIVNSTTSLTVDASFSQSSAPFIIYYGGINTSPSQIALSPLLTLIVNNIDTDATTSILTIGATHADYVQISTGIANKITTITSSPYNALVDDYSICCQQSAALTINFPASPNPGAYYEVIDTTGNASTNAITVNGNGKTINGSSTLVINTNYGSASFRYNGFNWNIL